MKIRGHGNGLAIALAGLAVVFAASGTAYAVTATTVNIADATTPSRTAKVDSSGRLNTVDPGSTVNITEVSTPNSFHTGSVLSAPTAATLAVSKFIVVPYGNLSGQWAAFLFQVPVLSDGTCDTSLFVRRLGFGLVGAGTSGGQDYAAPLVVTPVGGAKYCLDVQYQWNNGTVSGSEYFGVQITAYATAGRYTGTGAADAPTGVAGSTAEAVGGH